MSGRPKLTRYEAAAWQESWDRQQEANLPDREERFTILLDAVEALVPLLDRPPRVLDLAGGSGSISLRGLRRWPDLEITLVDLDPVLLTLAESSLAGTSAEIVVADLRKAEWADVLAREHFDAVLSATSLHWLAAPRIVAVYRDVHELLAPHGIFVNVDDMPDPDIPGLTDLLIDVVNRRRLPRFAAGAAASWEQWWDHVSRDPVLGPLAVERLRAFGGEHMDEEWTPPPAWHIERLKEIGFREAGVVWRGRRGAAVAALRGDI